MTALAYWHRLLAALMIISLASVLPLRAQDEPVPAPWQEIISAQVQAFRDRDAPAAFSFAGAGFQRAYQSPDIFFETIVRSGYSPIMESVSHSFGRFQRLGVSGVVQEVRFVGKDQDLYGAIYQLTEEEAGWRVQGVQMFRQSGVAI